MLSYDKIRKGIEIVPTKKTRNVRLYIGLKVVRIGFSYVVVQK